MQGTATRVRRVISSKGYIKTIQLAWQELYLQKFLTNSSVRKVLFNQFSLPLVNERKNCVVERDLSLSTSIQIPNKIWINSDTSIEEIETHAIPPQKLYSYENAILIVPPGLGITSKGELIPSSIASELIWELGRRETYVPKLLTDHGIRKTREILRAPTTVDSVEMGAVFPMVPYWSNYYHWTAECLPKLQWIEDYFDQAAKPTVIVPRNPPSWIIQSLDMLGVDTYCEAPEKIIRADKIYFPTCPEPSPIECQWLRRRAHSNVKLDTCNGEQIYISRQKANRRRVSNYDAVMKVLSEFGVEPYTLENMSVQDQVSLFESAELVVGPHGAGFANIIYSTDATVVELFGSRKKMTYYRLAKILGFEYEAVTGMSDKPDIHVDIEQLISVLKNVTNRAK